MLNTLVIALEIWALSLSIQRRGAGAFIYYTQLSNLYGFIACIACLVGEVRELRDGPALSTAVRRLKFSAACCLLMTFFVVMLVLAPMLCSTGQNGYYLMLCTGVLPVTHLLGPLLTFGTYVFFEAERSMTLRQSIVGLAPTLLYGLVAYPCNIARIWDGPYPFFRVWEMPAWQSVVWFIALLVMAFALSQVPRLMGRKLSRRE